MNKKSLFQYSIQLYFGQVYLSLNAMSIIFTILFQSSAILYSSQINSTAAHYAAESEDIMFNFNFNSIISDEKKRRAEHIITEAASRTIQGNGQDFVENAIDVAFEPLEKVESAISRRFNW